MRDLIESCCTCDEERTFVAMREAGHTLAEIAAAIGKSRMFHARIGKQLEARVHAKVGGPARRMIRRIFLDLDDVCNTLAPFVLHSVGCDIGPSDYARYPREHGFNISDAANAMLGESRYTPATLLGLYAAFDLGRRCPSLHSFSGSWKRAPRQSAARTSASPPVRRNAPRVWPGSWSGFTTTFPSGCTGNIAITPRKHLFARPIPF